jgi:isoquinoline 1-oxidoreductase subunit alpha
VARQSALHAAPWNGDLPMVKRLVEAGADLAARDAPGSGSRSVRVIDFRVRCGHPALAGMGAASMAISLTVNGRPRLLDLEPDTPLLWALRDTLGLTGTKFGCGIAACGACTVHVDGQPMRSCSVPVVAVEGASVTTIEGLAPEGSLHPVQQAWIDHQVPQCGYCQSGMIMAVSALLAAEPHPTDAQVDEAITNICRCGTFARVRRAIQALARTE